MLFLCLLVFSICSLVGLPLVVAFVVAVPAAVRHGKPLKIHYPPLFLLVWAASAAGVIYFWRRG